MTPLSQHLETLHDHARSFVTHWASDDGADDLPQARAACRDVASATSALIKANDAARTMLAALTEIVRESDGGWWTHHPTAKIVRAAIAQAKAAGITAEAPAHVIATSSDLAKGDAP